jgi:alpha-galactosidase/6-phospho-beta-glucosidase family protein
MHLALVAVLVVANPDGGAPLREGDFAYTSGEATRCSSQLSSLKGARWSEQAPALVAMYRRDFISCVNDFRARQEAEERRKEDARASEEGRAAKAQAQAEKTAHLAEFRRIAESIADDPKKSRPLRSALICSYNADRSGVLGAIAKEKKYSQVGGVIHVGRIGDLQDELAEIDDNIRAQRAALKEMGASAMSCKDKLVRIAASCLDDNTQDFCLTPEGLLMMEVVSILAQ